MPAPLKAPDRRVNRVPPARGEWVDLDPLAEAVLPAYPMHWYRRDLRPFVVPKYIWDLWRSDPVTGQFSPGDVATALELGEQWARLKPEHRLRVQTYLGLNARGRRDLRWREPRETEAAVKTEIADVKRLRIVSEEPA